MLHRRFLLLGGIVSAPSCEGNEGQKFFPDPENCKKFYQCWNEDLAHMECGPNTKFNPDGNDCVAGDC